MSNRIPEDEDNKQQRHLDSLHNKSTSKDTLTRHRGMATWGEKLVPLGDFHAATQKAGLSLSEKEREARRKTFLATQSDGVPVEGPFERVAIFGGVYNNSWGLESLLEETSDVDARYCLGDLGGFGPFPERVWPLLTEHGVATIQGNYEESLSSGREDCNCGYTDPRDNHFAEISYRYTEQNCSSGFKQWMGEQPLRRRICVGDKELLLVHGSPRRVNEFLFLSTSPVAFLETLCDQERADGFLCTHTGLPWHRKLPSGKDVINVGVIGRPPNNGSTEVCYAMLEARGDELSVEIKPLRYDYQGLANAMRRESLPKEFVDTVLTGWWTSCLEILPARERSVSRQ